MPRWLFWIALYTICVAAAGLVTPGLPEAMGFAAPALATAGLVAWFARRQPGRARLILATTAAAGLMAGALTGALGLGRAAGHPRAYEVAASPMA